MPALQKATGQHDGIRTTASGRGVTHDVGAGRSEGQPQGPDVILRMRVFCFLVKKERDVNGVAGLT